LSRLLILFDVFEELQLIYQIFKLGKFFKLSAPHETLGAPPPHATKPKPTTDSEYVYVQNNTVKPGCEY